MKEFMNKGKDPEKDWNIGTQAIEANPRSLNRIYSIPISLTKMCRRSNNTTLTMLK
jgi:hypothetical protein